MTKPIIGVLTWRSGRTFAEPGYFKRLLRASKRLGVVLYLFSPQDVDDKAKLVQGFFWSREKGWLSKRFPWPDVVIDRYRYRSDQAFKKYVDFRKRNHMYYANHRLANKWKVHQILSTEPTMEQWLPETYLYTEKRLKQLLERYSHVYIKPSNGTGGRGIVKVERAENHYHLVGRDDQRKKIRTTCKTLLDTNKWLTKWRKKDKWIVQQGLQLDLIPKRSVDVRLLIQKEQTGVWDVTGMGVRIGPLHSATSNLHGGGQAKKLAPFLESLFGAEGAHIIIEECHQLARRTALTVERHFGRMLELALDIGIDVNGYIWLIEVNPKPGREIFRELGQIQTYQQSIERPIQYAKYLASVQ
ncbi:YheC/YheD family endospore coat-associated protein [Brevibacillus laterosporus]|uniref:YheC/YheD family endospore coat-associated protein n=1 Tax=Brevibacillus laterosporus TaxID=1465 RepID=UPI000E6BC4EE|nr:YheC/YheD family protein [Brevibacillus laterosporus]AYB38469.1 YheC/YheD family protein [Brevibacillus laterosporus]MBM7111097.1 Endospore coat-associated protein YheD [Brevibacillus laterosporus]